MDATGLAAWNDRTATVIDFGLNTFIAVDIISTVFNVCAENSNVAFTCELQDKCRSVLFRVLTRCDDHFGASLVFRIGLSTVRVAFVRWCCVQSTAYERARTYIQMQSVITDTMTRLIC